VRACVRVCVRMLHYFYNTHWWGMIGVSNALHLQYLLVGDGCGGRGIKPNRPARGHFHTYPVPSGTYLYKLPLCTAYPVKMIKILLFALSAPV
jgi:hypothetical protein